MLMRILMGGALALGLAMGNALAEGQSSGMKQDKSAAMDSQSLTSLQGQFSQIDSDGDGAISREEWTARENQLDNPPNFTALNSDDDADNEKVTKAEWDAYFQSQGSATTGSGSNNQ